MSNRLYLVDTATDEYLCLAKGANGTGWDVGNLDLYNEFMSDRLDDFEDKTTLIIGNENDNEFFKEHIENGENYNKTNKWK